MIKKHSVWGLLSQNVLEFHLVLNSAQKTTSSADNRDHKDDSNSYF